MSYTELQITTNFSFLRGASHPEELAEQAAALGYTAIAITIETVLPVLFVHMLLQKKEVSVSFRVAGLIYWMV